MVYGVHVICQPGGDLARAFTATFSGIVPAHAPAFVLSQCIGAGVGYGLARLLLNTSFGVLHQPWRAQDDQPAHDVLRADVCISK